MFHISRRVNATWEENRIEIINDSISYGILMSLTSILQFVSGIFCVDLFNYTAMKQITRIRVKFFQSLVRQDIGWYDTSTGNNFGVRITEYVFVHFISNEFNIFSNKFLHIIFFSHFTAFTNPCDLIDITAQCIVM